MATNTNLTRDIAIDLIKSKEVVCPNCSQCILVSRYRYKYQNTEYRCEKCGEIYHPTKLI